MRRWLLSAALSASLVALPTQAREQDKPIGDRDPNAMDVAKTPITDLNVGRDNEIPPLLTAAAAKPYSLDGLRSCRQLTNAIEALDEVLGPDIDLPQAERERISGGRVAKWVVSSFIPFRGLIREISGANEQDRKVQAAIQAGLTRRGFLKGVGATKSCTYPAAPAPISLVRARLEEMKAKENKKAEKSRIAESQAPGPPPNTGTPSSSGVTFTSEPVIQSIP